MGYLYVYMKLFDIILEDEELPQLTVVDPLDTFKEKEKQRLINSPYTTGLTFDNVEVEKRENPSSTRSRTYIKDYGCKIHNDWFKKDWSRIDSVLNGNTGCEICGMDKVRQRAKEFHTKPDEQLKQQLIDSPFTTGLTFDNVQFKRQQEPEKEIGRSLIKISIKNYSCKTHKWWKQNEWVRIDSVKDGKTGCKICAIENYDKLTNKLSDTWDGKLEDDENSLYNVWMKKRNIFLQKNWLKKSKSEHKNKYGRPKYGYDKVDFNDPNTIKYTYNPITKKYRREREFEIFCPKPNHGYFVQSAFSHKDGHGCPICRESKGEIYLSNLFTNNDIKYVRGKDARFNGLIGKKVGLTCDFYLPIKNVIVEYDGRQHFEPIFGSTEKSRMDAYNRTYTNDTIRDNFAKTNSEGISLIRIPYTMTDDEINVQLFAWLEKIKPNQVVKLGEYPSRKKPKSILAKNQIDLNKPIYKKIRTNESNLSLMGILGQI